MYSRASSSRTRAPRPSRKNTGVPPTAPNARTGEFTPPGMSSRDRSNSARLVSYIVSVGRREQQRQRARRGADIVRIENGGNDGEHVGAGGDDAGRVVRRDAADRGDRKSREALCLGEVRRRGAGSDRLAARSEHAAD